MERGSIKMAKGALIPRALLSFYARGSRLAPNLPQSLRVFVWAFLHMAQAEHTLPVYCFEFQKKLVWQTLACANVPWPPVCHQHEVATSCWYNQLHRHKAWSSYGLILLYRVFIQWNRYIGVTGKVESPSATVEDLPLNYIYLQTGVCMHSTFSF